MKLVCLLGWIVTCTCSAALPDYIAPEHAKELSAWLEDHKQYRLATLDDCDCLDDVLTLRRGQGNAWKPQPKYQPYYATGDFNGDGIRDFAVVIRLVDREDGPLILVFFGGKTTHARMPLGYPLSDKSIKNVGLFLGQRQGRRTPLLFGAFSSEAEEIEIPKAQKKP